MEIFNPFNIDFSGFHLIEASAGTGKTYNIASLYIRAIIQENRTVDEILVVTFTDAAVKELRDRLMRRIRESIRALQGGGTEDDAFLAGLQNEINRKEEAIHKLKDAVHRFDEAAIYSIHGFCGHVLREYAFETGAPFHAELIGDDSEIVQEIVDDYWRNWILKNSKIPHRHPLIEFILKQKYDPEKLTNELNNYLGKPYLEIHPRNNKGQIPENKLVEFTRLFEDLKKEWRSNQKEIIHLLHFEHLSNYRENWLEGWINKMRKLLQADAAPFEYFAQIERFSQTYIDHHLKKASQKKGINPPQHRFFQLVDAYKELADFMQEQNYDFIFKKKLFVHLVEKLNHKKEELQVYSYDDLLIRLQKALCRPSQGTKLCQQLCHTYPVALVDEFQDTDPVQYQIFKTIYAKNKPAALFMIGDPKQSIYSFRGADVFVYLQARSETPAENRYSLDCNYRSTPSLLSALNAFFGSSENPFLLDEISYQPVKAGRERMDCLNTTNGCDESFEIRQLTKPDDDKPLTKDEAKGRAAKDTAGQIKKMLIEAQKANVKIGVNPLQAKDIAVLVRKHEQAERVKEELNKQEIKCIIHSDSDVFKSEEARQLTIILKAVAEPADERFVAAALSTALFNYNGNDLFELQQDGTRWAAKLEQFYRWHQRWQQRGFSFFFQTMMREEKTAETIMERSNGERMLTNLRHLSSLIHDEEQQADRGIHALVKWLLKKRNEKKTKVEEEQLRLESDENLVQVITQHHSKGLEYPVVFCPFLWDAREKRDDGSPLLYHDSGDNNRMILDLSGKNDPDRGKKRFIQAREELEESLRLMYVALTRAEQKCIINWIYANSSEYSPFGYFLIGENQVLKSLKAKFKLDKGAETDYPGQIQQSLDKLSRHPEISVQTVDDNNLGSRAAALSNSSTIFREKIFSRTIPLPKGKSLSSFSSLTQMNHDADFDTVEYYDEFIAQKNSDTRASGIFGFPKGPAPGTAIHQIFEHVDFGNTESWDEIIKQYLRQENIAGRWQPVVHKMLQQTVNKSLTPSKPSLKLAVIPSKQMVSEMRFHFTNQQVELGDLLTIIRPDLPKGDLRERIGDEGFMTGFIDLTFRFGHQYYILDYKTNHLGNEISDYNREKLAEAMKTHFYDLQYHLYLVALHRFLKQKLPDYDYRKHVGGALYLFVRGINENTEAGIYFDRPDKACIDELDRYFKENSAPSH